MNTIEKEVTNEIIINKSRFISYAYPVDNVIKALEIINEIKKKYKDATHYCYAYVIGNIKKANDDNEPTHTAGMPILNVIDANELNNILIIVVRYFGGIKLGAGGLTRAYSNSASEVIKKANIILIKKELTKTIKFDYKYIDKINYILKNYKIIYKEFDDDIIYEFIYEENNYPKEIDNYIK